MKNLLLDQLSKLALVTLVGTSATLIGSQMEGRADSLTNNALNRQTVSPATIRSDQPILQNTGITRSDNTLSQPRTFHSNEILKTSVPAVGGENTVPTATPAAVEPSTKPTVPAVTKPANSATVKPKPKANPNQAAKGEVKSRRQGMASWYGPGFHGRKTASGERFNSGDLTAAHRSLPFGTRVRVTNARTGRSVVVRINDRGPFSGGRIIDLSKGAARAIGVFQSGVAPVLLEVLGR